MARCIFGPRQTTACPSGTNMPMLITADAWWASGASAGPSTFVG